MGRRLKQSGPKGTQGEMEFDKSFVPTRPFLYFSFVGRAPGNPRAALQLVKQKVWELDPKLPISTASTMADRLSESIARPRFYLTVSSGFAVTGALLGAIGVYGVAAYWVTRRRREIAIRVALGASRETVMSMVIVRGLKLAAIGAIVGVGSLKRFSAVRWGVAGRVVWAWVFTIPGSAILAALGWWVIARAGG